MKNLCFLLLIIPFITSCFSEQSDDSAKKLKNLDFYQFFSFDLSKYDIPATIMLPDETVGIGTSFIPEVKHNDDDFLWEVNIGPSFVFLIEDYGDLKDLVNQQKAKLTDPKNSFYSIKFLVNEPDILIYERIIKDSEGKRPPTYHAYAQKKINGIYYEFKTTDSGNTKKVIECFEKSFRSIKEVSKK